MLLRHGKNKKDLPKYAISNGAGVLGSDKYIYIIGGSIEHGALLSQLVVYPTDDSRDPYLSIDTRPPRQRASATAAGNRLFIYGGEESPALSADGQVYQLVLEKNCYNFSCSDCFQHSECGWCSNSACFAGVGGKPYAPQACSGEVALDSGVCEQGGFPDWAIALIVFGGVILVAIIVFAILKLRGRRKGYSRVPGHPD